MAKIKSLFDQYNVTLLEQKKKMSEEITKWGSDLIREITQYVADQKKLLEEQFENQKRAIEAKRKQSMSDLAKQEKKKDNEEINRLLAECKDLKFELTALEYCKHRVNYIQVTTEDQLAQKSRNENGTEEKLSRNKSAKDKNSIIDDGNPREASPLMPTSTSAKQTSQKSIMTQTSSEIDQTTNGDDNSKPDVNSEDDMTNKCPICFMIFPRSMVKHDREQHVNAHYGDD